MLCKKLQSEHYEIADKNKEMMTQIQQLEDEIKKRNKVEEERRNRSRCENRSQNKGWKCAKEIRSCVNADNQMQIIVILFFFQSLFVSNCCL